VTYDRIPIFEEARARDLIGEVIRNVRDEMPFETIAIVLLPDHLHAVWALPPGDKDFSSRWKKIKADFTARWLAMGGSEARVTESQARRGNRGIWQRRFIEHLCRDEDDLERHCDYIHYNPVKHGYVIKPWDWEASSFRRFVDVGQYEWDWGRSAPVSIVGMRDEI